MAKFDKMAKKAAELGASPGQEMPGARIKSVRPYRAQAQFSTSNPPLPKGTERLYAGTKIWTRNQQQATGQEMD